jgi:hypothetical protein
VLGHPMDHPFSLKTLKKVEEPPDTEAEKTADNKEDDEKPDQNKKDQQTKSSEKHADFC